jgi:hypothetical protein
MLVCEKQLSAAARASNVRLLLALRCLCFLDVSEVRSEGPCERNGHGSLAAIGDRKLHRQLSYTHLVRNAKVESAVGYSVGVGGDLVSCLPAAAPAEGGQLGMYVPKVECGRIEGRRFAQPGRMAVNGET